MTCKYAKYMKYDGILLIYGKTCMWTFIKKWSEYVYVGLNPKCGLKDLLLGQGPGLEGWIVKWP